MTSPLGDVIKPGTSDALGLFGDEDNEQESEVNETAEGVEQKGRSPSPVKCKPKQSENPEDDNEAGDSDTEPKRGADETESQDDADSSQHSKATQEPHPPPDAVGEQDQPVAGLPDESTEDEMNTQTDSQISYMEAEDSSITKEEKIEEEPLAPEVDKSNQENKGEEKGSAFASEPYEIIRERGADDQSARAPKTVL
ncbi:PREDICTED: neuromodulin-like [Gekko japonicus]|uniref:Neuromodulin-like n=1 Tax=Gekko japonicus TaxID=146911 RepID=A0ABM1L379_GEKJA|nr:PREDICTED: neuromodulin-like [Gekko japonicus]